MEYTLEDLDFIFVRQQNKETGYYENISLTELTTKQFQKFFYNRFKISIIKEKDESIRQIPAEDEKKAYLKDKSELTKEDRLDIINYLSKHGAIFYMVSRNARDNF
jgi:hypothetical protein